jgi:hypothetical protein
VVLLALLGHDPPPRKVPQEGEAPPGDSVAEVICQAVQRRVDRVDHVRQRARESARGEVADGLLDRRECLVDDERHAGLPVVASRAELLDRRFTSHTTGVCLRTIPIDSIYFVCCHTRT